MKHSRGGSFAHHYRCKKTKRFANGKKASSWIKKDEERRATTALREIEKDDDLAREMESISHTSSYREERLDMLDLTEEEKEFLRRINLCFAKGERIKVQEDLLQKMADTNGKTLQDEALFVFTKVISMDCFQKLDQTVQDDFIFVFLLFLKTNFPDCLNGIKKYFVNHTEISLLFF